MPEPAPVALSEFFTLSDLAGRKVLHPARQVGDWCVLDEGLAHTSIGRSALCKQLFDSEDLLYRGIKIVELLGAWDQLDVAALLVGGNSGSVDGTGLRSFTINQFHSAYMRTGELAPLKEKVDAVEFIMTAVMLARGHFDRAQLNKNDRLEVLGFIMASVAAAIAFYSISSTASPNTQIAFPAITETSHSLLEHLLRMAFDRPTDKAAVEILNKFLILHAEHGLNTSATVVRGVASAGGDPFAAIVAGMAAFKADLHGGASQIVGELYDTISDSGTSVVDYINHAISTKQKLMGFGGRARKYRDRQYHEPRVSYMRDMIRYSGQFEPIADIARISLEFYDVADTHSYFAERKLFANADIFNGVLIRRAGFPPTMNTMLLCFSRLVGWLSHYFECRDQGLPIIRSVDLPQ
ncbi:citrate/2-methylcitrate synthase [Rhizobium ruizarguesonis]|uniref:citrate/2-methylcitrate synthase n=1 Tax=Rhizobium ruizarguesonis TaxID=2081791 RepID=UPI003722C4B1